MKTSPNPNPLGSPQMSEPHFHPSLCSSLFSFKLSFLPLSLILLFFLSTAGCPGRSGIFYPRDVETEPQQPEWVFQRPGPGTYEGTDVILAVGVDSQALDHGSRLENATEKARDRLEGALYVFCKRIGGKAYDTQEIPDYFAEVIERALSVSASKTSERLADKSDPAQIHDSLLRREVFVKLLVPVEKIVSSYASIARKELEIRLRGKMDGDELEEFLSEIESHIEAAEL